MLFGLIGGTGSSIMVSTLSCVFLADWFQGSNWLPVHCAVFLGKTINSHGAPLHPSVEMGTDDGHAGG